MKGIETYYIQNQYELFLKKIVHVNIHSCRTIIIFTVNLKKNYFFLLLHLLALINYVNAKYEWEEKVFGNQYLDLSEGGGLITSNIFILSISYQHELGKNYGIFLIFSPRHFILHKTLKIEISKIARKGLTMYY